MATVSKKLAHVGLSAFHNEYMALRHAASMAMWMRNILTEINCEFMGCTMTAKMAGVMSGGGRGGGSRPVGRDFVFSYLFLGVSNYTPMGPKTRIWGTDPLSLRLKREAI